MKKTGTRYLFLRGNTYYYRKPIPLALQHHFNGEKTKQGSLETHDLRVAKMRLAEKIASIHADFLKLQKQQNLNVPTGNGERTKLITRGKTGKHKISPPVLPKAARWLDELSAAELDYYIAAYAREEIEQSKQAALTRRPFPNEAELEIQKWDIMEEKSTLENAIAYGDYREGNSKAEYILAERGVGVRGADNKLHQMAEILVRLDNYFMGRTLSELTRQPISVDPEITKYLNYESSLTLSETIKIYADRQLLNLRPISYKSALEQLNRIKQIFGADTPIKTITRQQCVEAARVISYLPANMNLRYKDMTPQEAEIAGREDGARIISTKTANDYLTRMKALFSFAEDDQIIDKNPARNLTLARSNEDSQKRRPFTVHQLNTLFSAPLYTGCVDDERNYTKPGPNKPRNARFWAPLLALWTGMRMEECLQLFMTDIAIHDGIPVIYIQGDGIDKEDRSRSRLPLHQQRREKSIKNSGSVRIVPIHPELIKIGFLEFHASRTNTGDKYLFSELRRGSNNKFSHSFSKWFSRFINDLELKTSERHIVFHSLRHNYRDALRDTNIPHQVQLELGGWSQGIKPGASEEYGIGYKVKRLRSAIEEIKYEGLDLSHLYI